SLLARRGLAEGGALEELRFHWLPLLAGRGVLGGAGELDVAGVVFADGVDGEMAPGAGAGHFQAGQEGGRARGGGLPSGAVGVVVAAGTVQLHAKERLADGLRGVLWGIAILNVVEGAVLYAVPFRLEQFPGLDIVGNVLLEARLHPGLETLALVGVVPRRA